MIGIEGIAGIDFELVDGVVVLKSCARFCAEQSWGGGSWKFRDSWRAKSSFERAKGRVFNNCTPHCQPRNHCIILFPKDCHAYNADTWNVAISTRR